MTLPSTLIFDQPSARQLSTALQPEKQAEKGISSLAAAAIPRVGLGGSVGIEGVSALMPSGASTADAVRRMVACGGNAIAEVPASRWAVGVARPPLAVEGRTGVVARDLSKSSAPKGKFTTAAAAGVLEPERV